MNNTQQAGETAKDDNLFTQAQKDYVSGVKDEDLRFQLLHQVRLRDIMESDRDAFERMCNKPPAPDAVEAKEFDATALPEVIKLNKWMEGKDLPDALKLGFKLTLEAGKAIGHVLAGHAEGQKAAVEAKSAGVWVNELRRLLESESVKALLRFAYKNPMRSGMDDFEGKEYIDLYHFDTSVMHPSTPQHMNNTQQAGETAKVIAILKKELQTQELVKQHYKMQTDQKLKAQGYKGPFAPAHDEDLISQLSSVIKVLTESTPAPDAVEAKGMEWNDIDSPPEPLEVIVLIEGNEYNAYYTDDKWWVDYGGMTVGHKMIDEADIEGWRLPAAALTSSSAPAEQVDVTLLAKMASLAYSKDPEKTKAFEYGFALGMSHAEGQKADEKTIWKVIEHFQEMRESPEDTITYNELEADLYGLFDKPLAAPVAEGQKATVSEDRVQKLLTEAPVPCLLTWALKYCNSDQLAALRDGLIYRTPSTAAPSAKSAGDVFELVDVEINPAVSGEYRVVFPDGNSGLFEYEAEIDMWVNTYGGEDEWFLGEEAKYYRPIIPTSHAEGEKGAVGFAEWTAAYGWSFNLADEKWSRSLMIQPNGPLTSLELYNLYLKSKSSL